MSYEMFRCDVINNLTGKIPEEHMQSAVNAVDTAATKYDFALKEVSLSVVDSMPKYARMYLAACSVKGLSKGTLDNYFYALRKFFSYINKPVDQITTNDVRVYLHQFKQDTGASDRTLEKKRVEVNSFFQWLADEGIIDKNPVNRVEPIKYYAEQRRAMTLDELETVRFACKDLREKAVIDFLYSTGCRVSELCNMDIADIDLSTRLVRVRMGKGRKDRITYMNAESVISMRAYLNSRTDDCPALIVNRTKSVKHRLQKKAIEVLIHKVCERAKVNWNVCPHHLRHTMATVAIHNGCPIEHVQRMLGHAKLTTTMEYVKIVDEDVFRSHEKCVV